MCVFYSVFLSFSKRSFKFKPHKEKPFKLVNPFCCNPARFIYKFLFPDAAIQTAAAKSGLWSLFSRRIMDKCLGLLVSKEERAHKRITGGQDPPLWTPGYSGRKSHASVNCFAASVECSRLMLLFHQDTPLQLDCTDWTVLPPHDWKRRRKRI